MAIQDTDLLLVNRNNQSFRETFENIKDEINTNPPTDGQAGHWERTGTTVSPTNAGDTIATTGRLLVGTATSRPIGAERGLQVEGLTGASGGASIVRNSASAGGPALTLGKSRGAANGSVALVQDGDSLGTILFNGANGIDLNTQAAGIAAVVDGATGGSSIPGRLVFNTTPVGSVVAQERMRLSHDGVFTLGDGITNAVTLDPGTTGSPLIRDSVGRVLIGATSPYTTDTNLQVTDANNPKLTLNAPGKSTFSLATETGAGTADNGLVVEYGGAQEMARIDAGGVFKLGSNYLTPAVSLDPGSTGSPLVRDAQGRLLVGTASTSQNVRGVFQGGISAGQAGVLVLARDSNTANQDDTIGLLRMTGNGHAGGSQIRCAADGAAWNAGVSQPTRLVFETTPSGSTTPVERMRIGADGNVMVAPSGGGDFGVGFYGRLGANFSGGGIRSNGQIITYRDYGASDPSTVRALSISAAGTDVSGTYSDRCVIFGNGDVENANNSYGPLSSDERLKQDIVDIGSQWDDIKGVRLTKFHYKNDPNGQLQLGPIAQELEKVCPGLITRRPASEAEVADRSNNLVDGDEVLSFKASILYMKAVGALQEAMARIEAMEAKNTQLEAVVVELSKKVA